MFRTTVIAVTGSVGKSTCMELTRALLSSKFPVHLPRTRSNHYRGVIMAMAGIRPWHRYLVVEIGITAPGQMAPIARALRPDIAIWVSVARTHVDGFGTLETTAFEKSQLVEAVRPGGLAILNDDNDYIARYAPPPAVRTVYYGSTARSSFRATGATSRWPDRLSFRLETRDGPAAPVETRLLGKHWLGSLLPCFAVAAECGMSVEETRAAISIFEPLERRLSPVELPSGAVILRDEANGSVDTMAAALRVFEDATASRKMIVFTDVFDASRSPAIRLRDYGTEVARIANSAVFLGDQAEHGARAAIDAGLPADQVWSFHDIQDCAMMLRTELRGGDLVLIRGRRMDHLDRLSLSMLQDVTCWRNRCNKRIQCRQCRLLAMTPGVGADGAAPHSP